MKNRVRELRTEAGMTQQQLAEQVRVSSRTIISLEKGQYNPSLLLGQAGGGAQLPDAVLHGWIPSRSKSEVSFM